MCIYIYTQVMYIDIHHVYSVYIISIMHARNDFKICTHLLHNPVAKWPSSWL